MASIWIGKSGLRLKYNKLGFLALAAATTPATAVGFVTLVGASRIGYFANGLNTECAIWACHPENDPTVAANRLLLFEMEPGQIINFDNNMSSLEFDAGTYLFVTYVGGTAPTSGKVKLTWWG